LAEAEARARAIPISPATVAEHLDMDAIGDVCVATSLEDYRRLLVRVLGDDTGTLAQLSAALRSGPAERIGPLAHTLKGSVGVVGLRALGQLAEHLDRNGASLNATERAQAADQLVELLATAREACRFMALI
jgi:HPt (histidine-containing phosphotransfer) domain-containing protein